MSPTPRRLAPHLLSYLAAIAAVTGATMATAVLEPWMWPSVSLLFFPAILIPAMYGGYGSALLATVLSTASLAYFFVPPKHSLHVGIDDALRLAAFVVVAMTTAGLSSARRRAERAQRETLNGLRAALDTMEKVSGWPLLIGADTAASMHSVLRHGANAVGAVSVMGVWESEDEPWVYVAADGPSGQVSARHPPTEVTPIVTPGLETVTTLRPGGPDDVHVLVHRSGRVVETRETPLHPKLRDLLPGGPVASAPFTTEHLVGRVYFGGLPAATPDIVPAIDVVAREIGNSLDRLYVAQQMRELALREDRLRVSRDLHDGVLQALTGIRLEIQDIAEDSAAIPHTHQRLLAAERALATEQRELRRFIEGLKPAAPPPEPTMGTLAVTLRDSAARLALEWKTPIALRIVPTDLALPQPIEQPIRLMVHEAIVNALKHGHPSRVAVAVEAADSRLTVTVTDDGRGFPFKGRLEHEAVLQADTAPVSLRDRVAALNGRIAIDSGPRGARVEITLPV